MATNMFIKFDGVDGEAEVKGYEKYCEILSWNHGFSQPASPVRTSSGSTVEKATHSNLSITKYIDSATKDLLKACWNGTQFKTAVIRCFRADGGDETALEYLKIDLDEVIISNYSISGGGGDIPVENLSLAYGNVVYTYNPKKKTETGPAEGVKVVSHNLKLNSVGAVSK